MQRLEMIDDIRKYANLLMLEDPTLDYAKDELKKTEE